MLKDHHFSIEDTTNFTWYLWRTNNKARLNFCFFDSLQFQFDIVSSVDLFNFFIVTETLNDLTNNLQKI